jgi:hypothetical protein
MAPGISRRNVLIGMSPAGALAAAGWPGAAAAAENDESVTITIMGTSDIHSNAVNWDYYTDATFTDSAGNVVGLSRVSTVVNQIRADRGRDHTLLFDAGDTIQGTHPARVLLRDRRSGDRERCDPSDGRPDERDRVRRGRARQPRVQRAGRSIWVRSRPSVSAESGRPAKKSTTSAADAAATARRGRRVRRLERHPLRAGSRTRT